MTAPESIIEVEEVTLSYGSGVALNAVSLSVSAGASTAVIGLNGAGKTSLARVLSGLVKPRSGRVLIDGWDATSRTPAEIRRLGVSYVPEGRGVHPSLTVYDNLRMATRWLERRGERRAALEQVFEMFPVLAGRRQQQAGTLSGGEQQMLALGRALAVPPKVLIADELSLGLAPKVVDAVFEHLYKVRASGVTVLLIEQFVHRALEFADSVVVLRMGEVVWNGTATGITYEAIRDRYLGESRGSQGVAERSSAQEAHLASGLKGEADGVAAVNHNGQVTQKGQE